MATRDQLVESVLREYERFKSAKLPHCYNTGYGGRGVTSTETASMLDLEYAAGDLKSRVVSEFGSSRSVRTAKSFSGQNQWSILIEPSGKPPIFNFHMDVA